MSLLSGVSGEHDDAEERGLCAFGNACGQCDGAERDGDGLAGASVLRAGDRLRAGLHAGSTRLDMKLEAHQELMHGPYVAPTVRVGQELDCEMRGKLTVRRFSQGPIAWPMGHPGGQDGGRHSYIVCGDLVRAVQGESSQAVQHWWGVSEAVVTRWRKL